MSNKTSAPGMPPRAFGLLLMLVSLGGLAQIRFAPASWKASSRGGALILAMVGAQWAIWPHSNPISHPAIIRILGFVFLAFFSFILIFQFVTE